MAYNKTGKIFMKKILLVALALLVSTASFAQFRTAPREAGAPMATKSLDFGMASNFTVTTLDNQTIELQDWLDSGYYVLLDISATWCSWCWRLHQAHVLETLYQNYGPNGTNEMRVLWVEGDPTTNNALIYGGSGSQGDWTSGVSYPIAGDDNIADLFNLTGYPTVVLICPSGYYQDAYGVCDWNGSQFVTNTSVAAIYNLLGNCPAAGEPPVVEIEGLNTAVVNIPTTFTASYVSVDPVSSVSWSIPGATPSTGTGDNITVTFPTAGNYTVTLEVTNTSGTATETLNVNVIEWTWGNTMDYTNNGSYVSSVGMNSGTTTWGVKYPAAFMADRNYLDNVQVYSGYDGHFTLSVYQTNPGSNPTNNDMLYQYTYAVSAETYNTLIPYDFVQLDNNKDLWVVLTCSDIHYAAAATDFSGDPNGSLIAYNGSFSPIYELSETMLYTWMIKTTTSATVTPLRIGINEHSTVSTGDPINFIAAGPAAASFSWTFEGGNPASATGNTATTTYATPGNYTVTLNATLNGESATATTTINAVSCDVTLPWTCGFESDDNLSCWTFIDADGDGYGWDVDAFTGNSNYVHSGNGVIGSASFINNIGALSPDNWMITPKIVIPAEGATLEYYVGPVDANYYQEYYSILVSTTGTNPADFTNTIFSGVVDRASWTKKSRSLAGFAGQTIYIAFRHYNIHDMYWMLIDDIKVTAGNTASISEVENANVTLYPNPVSNILHIEAQGIQEVNVMDINGRTVMSMQNANTIDMSNLASGVYFVRVITTDGVSTQKITRQ